MRNTPPIINAVVFIGAAILLSACTPAPSESSMDDRQAKALKDPFHYSPGDDIPDISGGGIGDFDSKAMGRDLNHVLNP
ncbi:MAG TPA: hypothetical protein VG326_05775 [Tepidisphaeraceae bacterium]|jgi:hypothetical protein|nr:hypothetical protein [Tepidisphaeraceae bacterium]